MTWAFATPTVKHAERFGRACSTAFPNAIGPNANTPGKGA